jgi:hypothetical protein
LRKEPGQQELCEQQKDKDNSLDWRSGKGELLKFLSLDGESEANPNKRHYQTLDITLSKLDGSGIT